MSVVNGRTARAATWTAWSRDLGPLWWCLALVAGAGLSAVYFPGPSWLVFGALAGFSLSGSV